MTQRFMTLTAISAVVASLALTACDRRDQSTAATANRDVATANEPARTTDSAMDRAKDSTRNMANDAKDATRSATDSIGDKVSDAVITTSVKTEIAKDSSLSALKINVDTDNGRVALHGTAPTMAAKEHATALAAGVKGVVSVDNGLTVEAKK